MALGTVRCRPSRPGTILQARNGVKREVLPSLSRARVSDRGVAPPAKTSSRPVASLGHPRTTTRPSALLRRALPRPALAPAPTQHQIRLADSACLLVLSSATRHIPPATTARSRSASVWATIPSSSSSRPPRRFSLPPAAARRHPPPRYLQRGHRLPRALLPPTQPIRRLCSPQVTRPPVVNHQTTAPPSRTSHLSPPGHPSTSTQPWTRLDLLRLLPLPPSPHRPPTSPCCSPERRLTSEVAAPLSQPRPPLRRHTRLLRLLSKDAQGR